MVEPLTLSAISLIVVSVTSLIHFLGPAADWWRIRFKLHKVVNYEYGSPEYAALWALLCYPQHVDNSMVTRRERRQLDPNSHPSWTITQVAKFAYLNPGTHSYCMRLAHGRDDMGRACIHMICFWEEELRFFQRKLFQKHKGPDHFVLLDVSNK